MRATTFDPAPGGDLRLAPVRVDLPRLAGVPSEALLAGYTSLRLAGGGLWSTAGDVLRFGRAILRRGELDGVRILSPAFVDLMTREVTVNGLGAATDVLRAEHYAIGWGKPGVARARPRHRHSVMAARPGRACGSTQPTISCSCT